MRRYIATLFRTFAAALILGVTALSFPACDDKPIEVITTDYGYALTVDDVKLGQTGELLIRITSGGTREETVTINYKIDDDLSLRLLVNGQTLTPGSAVQFDLTNQIRLTLPELPAGRHVLHLILTNKYEKSVSRDIAFNVIKDKVKATRVEAPSRVRMVKGSSLDTTVTISPADADILEMTALTSNPDVVKASVLGDGAAKTLRLEAGDAAGEARVDLRHEDFTGAAATVAVEVFEYVISGLRDLTLTVGGSETLRLAVTPSADISLSASNGNVSVFPEGNNTWTITGVRAGSTVLTASAAGATATCAVTVRKAEETIAITPMGATIASGSQKTFTVSSSSDWAAELSSDEAAIVERTATTVTVRNDNRAFTDSRVTLTVVNTADADKRAVADIRLEKRAETISLIETSSEAGRAVYEVAGDFDGWKIQSSPAGLKAQAAGTAVILTNETYKTIRGRLVVRTTAQGVDAVAEVSVPGLDVSLSKVTLAPTSFSVEVGSDFAFSATGTYSDGSTKELTQSADWTCSSNLQMTAPGRFSAVREGDAWVRAAIDGKEGRVSGYVEPVPVVLSGLEIDPASFNAYVDETKVFTATASYSDGSVKDVTSSAAWTASGPASASGKGSYKMTGTGDVVVTVSFTEGGKTLSARSRGSVTIPSGVVSRVEISPASASAKVGETLAFTGTVYYTDGQQDSKGTFTVTPAGVLSGSAGNYTAQAAGTATVTFSAGGKTASARATVLPADVTVQSVSLSAQTLSVQTGATGELTASAQMSDGSLQDVTRSASWTSSNPSVATVSAGTVRGTSAGTATITATYGGRTSGACSVRVEDEVKVTAVALSPASLSFTVGDSPKSLKASAVYNNGKNEDVTYTGTWASSNTAVATVSASGLVTAKAAGSAEISCTYKGVRGTAPVTVSAVAVTPVSLTLNTMSLEIFTGDNASLKAMVGFSDGSTNDYSASCTWTSSNSNVVAVDRGNVRGLAAGTATVTATYSQGGKTVTATCRIAVTDRPATLESLSISPSSWTMAAATEASLLDFSVRAQFSDGSSRDVTSQVVWSIPSGTYYAEVVGTTLRAKAKTSSVIVQAAYTYSGVTKTATFTLKITEEVKPKALSVNPKDISLITGKTWSPRDGGASLAVTYTDGTTKTISSYDQEWSSVSWSVKNTSIAYFNGQTLMTQKAGSTQIVASYGGLTAEIALTVTDAVTLSHITVAPASLTLKVGESGNLAVTAYLTDNSSHTATSCQWSSSNQGVASVSGGNVTARGAGSATITASYTYTNEGKSVTKTADVSVTVLVPVSRVRINGGESSLTMMNATTADVSVIVEPDNAANKNVSWSVYDGTGYVSVKPKGTKGESSWGATITANKVSGGANVVVRAVSEDNANAYADFKISIVQPVTAIDLYPAETEVYYEDVKDKVLHLSSSDGSYSYRGYGSNVQSLPVDIQVKPVNAYDKTVLWSSSNTAVAVVNEETGGITVRGVGVTDITVKSKVSPKVSSSFKLIVKNKVYRFTVDPASLEWTDWSLYGSGNAKTIRLQSMEGVTSVKVSLEGDSGSFFLGSAELNAVGQTVNIYPQSRNESPSDRKATVVFQGYDGNTMVQSAVARVAVLHRGKEEPYPAAVSLSLKGGASASMYTGDTRVLADMFDVEVKSQHNEVLDGYTLSWNVTGSALSVVGNATLKANGSGSGDVSVTAQKNGRSATSKAITVTVSDHAVQGITLDKTAVNFEHVGDETTLTASFGGTQPTNTKVNWTIISGSGSVSLNASGLSATVKALQPGDAVIRVTADADAGKYAECSIHVQQPVTEIILVEENGKSVALESTGFSLTAKISPKDADVDSDNQGLKWSIVKGDRGVSFARETDVRTEGNYKVHTAYFDCSKVGESRIRVSVANNPDLYKECDVDVYSENDQRTYFTMYGNTTNPGTLPISLKVGEEIKLNGVYSICHYLGSITGHKGYQPIDWFNDFDLNYDSSVVEFSIKTGNNSGVYLVGKSIGFTNITAKRKNKSWGTCNALAVTVIDKDPEKVASSVAIYSNNLSNASELEMLVGTKETVSAAVFDQNGEVIPDAEVSWYCSNTDVVGFSNMVVSALKEGEATLTATSGSASKTITIKVVDRPSSIAVMPANRTIRVDSNESIELTATGTYANGQIKNITSKCTWTVSKNGLGSGTVSPTGNVIYASDYTRGTTLTVTATLGGVSGKTIVYIK